MSYTLRFDGGANPNPGPCAGAYVVYYNEDNKDKVIAEGGKFIEMGTNNIGEYTGLIIGLEKCVELGVKNLFVEGDSLLVISHTTGKWKVKQDHLKVLQFHVKELLKAFTTIEFRHIKREYNGYADSLSDKTLEKKTNWSN